MVGVTPDHSAATPSVLMILPAASRGPWYCSLLCCRVCIFFGGGVRVVLGVSVVACFFISFFLEGGKEDFGLVVFRF